MENFLVHFKDGTEVSVEYVLSIQPSKDSKRLNVECANDTIYVFVISEILYTKQCRV